MSVLDRNGAALAVAPVPMAAAGRPAASSRVAIDSLPPDAFDRLASGFDDIAFDQTACFSDGQWGARRMSHLVLQEGGIAVAGARVAILRPPGFARGLAYLRNGPFWHRAGRPPEPHLYAAALSALVEEYCGRRGHCLTIVPRPSPDHLAFECEALERFGFQARRPFHDPNRYLVDLTLDEDARMASLDKQWRYTLRQALKNGIEVRPCEAEEDFAAFAAMRERMVARKKFLDGDPFHLLPDLRARLPETMRPQLVLGFHEGRAVAGAIVARLGDTAHYMFGASDAAGLRLNAAYAVQWWIAGWLNRQGLRWYDLGSDVRDAGLRYFKKGFSGKKGAIVTVPAEFDLWTDRRGKWAADAIYALRGLKWSFDEWRVRRAEAHRT